MSCWDSLLSSVDGPPVVVCTADAVSITSRPAWEEAGFTVCQLRGKQMQQIDDLLEEFRAGLNFPSYFGRNLDAFDECISDLDWLDPGRGYVIVIDNAQLILRHETSSRFAWLVSSLTAAADAFAVPIAQGETWDRAPVPFHVVLTTTASIAAQVESRWAQAGAQTVRLP